MGGFVSMSCWILHLNSVKMDYIMTIVIPIIVKIFKLRIFLIVMYRHSVNVPDHNRRL